MKRCFGLVLGIVIMVFTLTGCDSLADSIQRNLITENRWKLIVEGLGTTVIISICSFMLATVLGFLLCMIRISKNKLGYGLSTAYILILRATPTIVFLMIVYYIVFSSVAIDPVVAAIVAFGLSGAAFHAEIFRSAILAVDKGQVEAARSMGFSKIGAFFLVTFPQMWRIALPTYQSEFVTTFKLTSVVGYISILDLTKAGDTIRGLTYDAFFPLLFVALIYIVVINILILIFNMIIKSANVNKGTIQ